MKNSAPAPARCTWSPDAKDHLVYQWVKFEGQTQSWAALQLGISQSTVSRIIDRYERWQAHADPREGGRLDPAERQRAQRWLTYERNELILASALRIANRMEGCTEMSKSVRTRPLSQFFSEGTEIRSEERTVDRHGVAARFLRLAFRINMEQLKLVEQESPPVPQPLSAAELAEQDLRDAAVAEELQAAEQRLQERIDAVVVGQIPGTAPDHVETPAGDESATEDSAMPTGAMQEVHNLHNADRENLSANDEAACSCVKQPAAGKKADRGCIPAVAPDSGNSAGQTCWDGAGAHSSGLTAPVVAPA
jgi:hypothetical protein